MTALLAFLDFFWNLQIARENTAVDVIFLMPFGRQEVVIARTTAPYYVVSYRRVALLNSLAYIETIRSSGYVERKWPDRIDLYGLPLFGTSSSRRKKEINPHRIESNFPGEIRTGPFDN